MQTLDSNIHVHVTPPTFNAVFNLSILSESSIFGIQDSKISRYFGFASNDDEANAPVSPGTARSREIAKSDEREELQQRRDTVQARE